MMHWSSSTLVFSNTMPDGNGNGIADDAVYDGMGMGMGDETALVGGETMMPGSIVIRA